MTTAEAAEFLRLKPRSFERLLRDGAFRLGEHFFERPRKNGARRGRVHRLWKRDALVAWIEAREHKAQESADVVPLAEPTRRSA